jgi:L-iditol 2-dehydrogenase
VARKIIEGISSGQLKVKDLITHTFPLSDFTESLNTFTTRKDGALKVVIEPNGEEEESA